MTEHDWTFATFYKYIDQRFADLTRQYDQRFGDQEKSVITALASAEKAVDKAERAQMLRNETQNEFRASLSDLSGLMWTTKEGIAALEGLRREMDIRMVGIENKVTELSTANANMQGRFTMIGIIWGVVVVAISALVRWFR